MTGWSAGQTVLLAAITGGAVSLVICAAAALVRRWWRHRRPLPCGPGRCHSPTACLAPKCYGRLRYGPDPDPGGLIDPPLIVQADPASERLWQQFDSPGLPYPDWYRPQDDRAAAFGPVQHGAGAARYFARNMHDHRRGAGKCRACQQIHKAMGGDQK